METKEKMAVEGEEHRDAVRETAMERVLHQRERHRGRPTECARAIDRETSRLLRQLRRSKVLEDGGATALDTCGHEGCTTKRERTTGLRGRPAPPICATKNAEVIR